LLGGPIVGYLAFLLSGFLFIIFLPGSKKLLSLVIYLFLAVGLLVGGLTHSWLNNEETVARISLLPLIGSLLKDAAIRAGLAIMAGAACAVLVVGLSLWLVVSVSREWVLALGETYGSKPRLLVSLLRSLALGSVPPYITQHIAQQREITRALQAEKRDLQKKTRPPCYPHPSPNALGQDTSRS
jgi:hypothetical protein